MRSLKPASHKGWNSIVLQDSGLTLRIVPEVGGRLMSIEFQGHEICFVHPQLEGKVYRGSADQWLELCQDWSFPLWGGGKTWVAPESAWPRGAPHRDLDSLPWILEESWIDDASMGVQVRSEVCRDSGLQIMRRLSLPAGANGWTVEHELCNAGAGDISCGLWDVLMLQRPARVSVPLARQDDVQPLPGHPSLDVLAAEGIFHVADGGAWLDCDSARIFKCGFHGADGRMDVSFGSMPVRYSRHSAVRAIDAHAHGHPLEVFNAPRLDYFEIETHSPMHTLRPAECIRYLIHEGVSPL